MSHRSAYRLSSVPSAQKGIVRKTTRAKPQILTMTKKEILKVVISVLIAALTALAAGLGLTSCNVTRTVTTRSETWQRGDTSVVIQTKTVESYDATKRL